jgi:hypothetical protein
MFTPVVDNIIESLRRIPPLVDSEMHFKLTGIFQEMSCIKPGEKESYSFISIQT